MEELFQNKWFLFIIGKCHSILAKYEKLLLFFISVHTF